MHIRLIKPLSTALALLAGCEANISQDGLEQRTAQAIWRFVGQFAITDHSEEVGGRFNYTVDTRDGAAYRCYLVGATSFKKAMCFGQAPHSDAICTAMAGDKSGSGNEGPAGTGQSDRSGGADCNALLQAAGRCGTVIPEVKLP